jgi:osmoprotectant transport system permease protein
VSSLLDYVSSRSGSLVTQGLEHVQLVIIAILAATVVGVALGVIAHRAPVVAPSILNVESTLLTIPSLALFAVLIPLVGIGPAPAIIGLFLYSLLPITRNTVAGLAQVDRAIVESARGMGMSRSRVMLRIELPLAWPVIITGVRVATLLVVGIGAVAALVGGPGLGNEIYLRGIRRLGSPGAADAIWAGTIAIVVIAFAFDLLYLLIARLTTPRGIR